MNAKIGFAALFCFLFAPGQAQTWDTYRIAGGPGEESFTCLEAGPEDDVFVTGTYYEPFEWDGFFLPEYGSGDLFLARLDGAGMPVWVLPGGGLDTEESTALAARTDGRVFWGGAFWDQITIGAWTWAAPAAGKALFLLEVSGEGIPETGKVFSGPGAKALRDLILDQDNNLYAIGFFGGALTIEDTTLQAHGELDGFAAKWNAAGEFQWATRFGEAGEVRGECLAVRHNAQLFLGGRFNGSISMAGTDIQSNTWDEDGFVAALSAETGQALWLRKAGAQYDSAVNALVVNETNELFATGTFVGVLQVAEGWTIATQGFNTNFFLIRYDALDGTPEWAQSLGNGTDEQGLSMEIRNEGPVVAGLFRNSLTLEGQTITGAGEGFNGFAAAFRPEGSLRWMLGFPGDGFVIPEAMAVMDDGAVWFAGGFSGTAFFNGEPILSDGFFDAWVGKLSSGVTATREQALWSLPGRVFPNPVSDLLFLDGFPDETLFRLLRPDGIACSETEITKRIDMRGLPDGLYYLQVWAPEKKSFYTIPILKIEP